MIVFHKLQKEEIKEIVELLLLRIRESMAERELQLELTEPAKEMLVNKGWDPAMGARPLRRAIQRYVEDPLADFVLREELTPGATVVVNPPDEDAGDQVHLTVVKPKKPKKTPVAVGAREEEQAEEVTGESVPSTPEGLIGDSGLSDEAPSQETAPESGPADAIDMPEGDAEGPAPADQ